MNVFDQIAETRAERRLRLQKEVAETTETTETTESKSSDVVGWQTFAGILFGGIILTVLGISRLFGLGTEAEYQLTRFGLSAGIVVTALGLGFARRWLTLRMTLAITAAVSVGILLFVLWIVSQSSH